MRCRDGTRLISRIWHPPSGHGPAPVLLMRQPYGRSIASTVTYAPPHWYARQGFLVVVQDVRGRGDSEGHFGGFGQEARDGADAVRWARQLPESNGRLGMYGFSYQGLTQLLNDGGGDGAQAVEQDRRGSHGGQAQPGPDPLPDCLAPAMCGLDERQHWASEGGAHWWGLGLGWALQLAAQGLARRGDHAGWHEIRQSLSRGTFLEQGLELLQRHDPDGMGWAWLQRPCNSADGWSTHHPAAALLRRPMLLLGGWWDPHLRGVLDLWGRSRAAGGDPEMLIGPWSHLHWNAGQPLPPATASGAALSIDQLQLAFFRQHLLAAGAPTEATDRTASGCRSRLHDAGSGSWVSTSPCRVQGGSWQLQSHGLAVAVAGDGALLPLTDPLIDPLSARDPDHSHGIAWLVHDPWRPHPGRGGHLGLDAGPCRREDLDQRLDGACFNTAPLQATLTLQGEPELELLVQADQPGFDLCCALSVLRAAAQGGPPEAHQLSTGILRVIGEEALESRRRRVRFQPLLITLKPGERLRLSLAAAAWPQVAVNPGNGSQPQGGPGPEHRVITLTLQLDGSRLSMKPMVGPD